MEKIVVLDFGSQYTHLLARRIRQLNVYSEIWNHDVPLSQVTPDVKGIILSGGPASVYEKDAPTLNIKLLQKKIPLLGLCYGHQLIGHLLKGTVQPGATKEYGLARLMIRDKSQLLNGLDDEEIVWMSHGDQVAEMPIDFIATASTPDCPVAAMENKQQNIYGLQFHPEVTHTKHGMKILENFVKLCGCKQDWNIGNFISTKIKEIKEFVHTKKVFLLVSGGVDSTVCFSLLNKALSSKRVYGLFIDNGFVRKGEAVKVQQSLEKCGFTNFHVVDASNDFLDAVRRVYDPEEKRKIIGEVFLKVQKRALKKLKLDPSEWILGQGTIYPDTIETKGTKNAALIKTHHNRVEAVQRLIEQGKVIEPLKELYKDEVREVGYELGLQESMVERHPFPGPGLAVRCLCLKEKVPVNAMVEKKINQLTAHYNLKALVLPIKSVGVQGDFRTYRQPVVLEGNADWKTLEEVSTKITNAFKEVNRVLYLVAPSKLIAVNAHEGMYLTKDRLDMLREADALVLNLCDAHNITDHIWQFPVVLIPVGVKRESIVLRPIDSENVMTVSFSKLPMKIVQEMAKEILKLPIDYVFYDVTHKPPATVEWE